MTILSLTNETEMRQRGAQDEIQMYKDKSLCISSSAF